MILVNHKTPNHIERKISSGPSQVGVMPGKCFPQFLEELVIVKKHSKEKVFDAIEKFLDPLLHPTQKNIEQSSSFKDGFRIRLYRLIENPEIKLTTEDQDEIQSIITMHALKTTQFQKR
jgi:hypothetical protein